jgi:hypothetical protein
LRACEGSLAVDDPFLLKECVEEGLKGAGITACGVGKRETQLSSAVSALEAREELGSKDPGEGLDRCEEVATRGDPSVTFEGEPPRWDDAVEMRVVGEGLTPGMQEGETAAARAEVGGVSGERTEGVPGAAKEQIVETPRIPEKEGAELLRQSKDEVEIADRE